MLSPETRPSLLLRIRDRGNAEAWDEFVSLYRPIVLRLARSRGMQVADAEDLAQQVLIAISEAIDRYHPDSGRAKFRTWLQTIARRAIVNAMTRGGRERAVGGGGIAALLDQQPADASETQTLLLDYRREIFVVAAEQIRCEFAQDTWTAFWDTAVKNQPVDQVADRLGRSRGNVYTSRSRVMKRLKQVVSELDLASEMTAEPYS